MSKIRRILFTLWEYTDDDIIDFLCLKHKYIVMGFEIGPECGRPHLHCYIEFKNSRSWAELKKSVNPTTHMDKCKGNGAQNRKYCTKDGDYYEDGELSNQGERSDLMAVKKAVDEGKSNYEIAQENFGTVMRYGKGIDNYRAGSMKDRTEPPIVLWLWGPSGCGKTRSACTMYGTYYIKDATKWWDRYTQQNAIVIDDYDGNWPFRDLLRLLDRYPYQGQCKGAYVPINSKYIIITCDRPINEVYSKLSESELIQLCRRVSFMVDVANGAEVPGAEVSGNTSTHNSNKPIDHGDL